MVAPRCHTVSHAMAVGLRGVRAPGRFVRPQGRGGLGCQVQNEGGVCKLLQDRQCTAHPAEGKAEGPNRVSPRAAALWAEDGCLRGRGLSSCVCQGIRARRGLYKACASCPRGNHGARCETGRQSHALRNWAAKDAGQPRACFLSRAHERLPACGYGPILSCCP